MKIGCRAFVYICSMGQLLYKHSTQIWRALRQRQTQRFVWRCHLPNYLMQSRQESMELVLLILLFVMLCMEPVLHCLQVSDLWARSSGHAAGHAMPVTTTGALHFPTSRFPCTPRSRTAARMATGTAGFVRPTAPLLASPCCSTSSLHRNWCTSTCSSLCSASCAPASGGSSSSTWASSAF